MKLSKRIKRAAVFQLTAMFVKLANLVSRRTALFFGSVCSAIAWKLLARDRYKVHRHLNLVYGDRMSYRQRELLGRSLYINMGKNIADVARLPRYFESEIKPLISCEGLENIAELRRSGRGWFGVTGHIGNFELLAAYFASLGDRVAVIGRELYNPRLDELLVANRRSLNITNLATTDSPRRILTWLKEGGTIGVLIDTDSFRVRSIPVPAFGRWSNTPVGQTILGLRAEAAFVPLACVRTENDRYRIIVREPIQFQPTGDFERDIYNVTSMCTSALEDIIRLYPDQWAWMHNRWRTKIPEQGLTRA